MAPLNAKTPDSFPRHHAPIKGAKSAKLPRKTHKKAPGGQFSGYDPTYGQYGVRIFFGKNISRLRCRGGRFEGVRRAVLRASVSLEKPKCLRHAGGRKYFDWIVSENNGLLRPPGGSWRATFGLIPTKENAGPPATPELSKPPERQGRGAVFTQKK